MHTTYYVVPALRHFSEGFADFPSRAMAERWVEQRKELGDDTDFGIFELRLVAGIGKATWGDRIHVRDDRQIITSKAWQGGWQAYDDGMGADDSPYGHGATEEEAIADCLEQIADAEERRASQKMEA